MAHAPLPAFLAGGGSAGAGGAKSALVRAAGSSGSGNSIAGSGSGSSGSDGTAGVVLAASASGAAGASAGVRSGKIDLNTATEAQLDTLPGVGPATAAKIVSDRKENGPFRSVDDLLRVPGIGPAKFDALKDLVTAG